MMIIFADVRPKNMVKMGTKISLDAKMKNREIVVVEIFRYRDTAGESYHTFYCCAVFNQSMVNSINFFPRVDTLPTPRLRHWTTIIDELLVESLVETVEND